jgi:glycopeptide antibiotics resistance protein
MHWLYLDIFQNILLTIPLGFGIGYFRKPGFLKIWLWALGTGIALEGIQLLTKLVFVSYRVVDINDAIMNALGVLIGYGLFLFCRKFFTRMEKSKSILKP